MIVYIWGNLTADNFTPRPGRDAVGARGREAGLSASERVPPGRKVQGVDLRLLRPPLRAFPDRPEQGGAPGHIAIAPVDESGRVDMDGLEHWASFRKTGQVHPLTQILLDAVVLPNVRGD